MKDATATSGQGKPAKRLSRTTPPVLVLLIMKCIWQHVTMMPQEKAERCWGWLLCIPLHSPYIGLHMTGISNLYVLEMVNRDVHCFLRNDPWDLLGNLKQFTHVHPPEQFGDRYILFDIRRCVLQSYKEIVHPYIPSAYQLSMYNMFNIPYCPVYLNSLNDILFH